IVDPPERKKRTTAPSNPRQRSVVPGKVLPVLANASRPTPTPSSTAAISRATRAIYVARQPIFEGERRLFGYELLYRRSAAAQSSADGPDSQHMSADVIVSALLGLGMSNLTGHGLAFVNFAREQLLARDWQLFERKSVV